MTVLFELSVRGPRGRRVSFVVRREVASDHLLIVGADGRVVNGVKKHAGVHVPGDRIGEGVSEDHSAASFVDHPHHRSEEASKGAVVDGVGDAVEVEGAHGSSSSVGGCARQCAHGFSDSQPTEGEPIGALTDGCDDAPDVDSSPALPRPAARCGCCDHYRFLRGLGDLR